MQIHAEQTTTTAPVTTEQETAPTLYALAVDVLTEFSNDADAAEETLYERLQSSPALLRSLVRGAVRTAVNANVARVLGTQRRSAFNSIKAAQAGRARAEALAKGISSALLDMPLADGTRLRDATRFEIMAAIDRYQKASDTMAHRARWLSAIVAILPDGRRCGDIISEKKAMQLYKSAA